MAEELTVVGEGEAPPVVDWGARHDELTAEAGRLDLELAAVDGLRGRFVAEQAEGDPAAGEKLAELHRMAGELRERRADVTSALAVVRQRREAAAQAGLAEHRERMRELLEERMRERLVVAVAIDETLMQLEAMVRGWSALAHSASAIAHGSLALPADAPLFSDRLDELALRDAIERLAPSVAEMLRLPDFVPGLARDPPPQQVAVSEQHRAAVVRARVAQAAERERQEADEPDGLVILRRVA